MLLTALCTLTVLLTAAGDSTAGDLAVQGESSHPPEVSHAGGAGQQQQQPRQDLSLSTTTTSTSAPYQECGGQLVADGGQVGVLASPGYPQQYTAGLHCVWSIRAPAGIRVRVTLTDFEVTATPGCTDDYLAIGSDSSSLNTSRLCGGLSDVDPTHTSPGNVLTIVLHTAPDGETCRGFRLTYDVQEVAVSCGSVTSQPQLLFRHPEHPAPAANTSTECRLTVQHQCEDTVCQIRLDFVELRLSPPELGECRGDRLLVQGQSVLPPLCGDNSGQHVYVDVSGRSSTELVIVTQPILPRPVGHTVDPVTGDIVAESWQYETENNRGWTIRVTQVPCGCSAVHLQTLKAPDGCLQYHTGVTGIITSFNFDGHKRDLEPCWNGTERDCGKAVWTGHLNHLQHHVCVQQQEGYCGILYQPTGPDSFLLSGQASFEGSENRKNLYGSSQCQSDYLVVPKSRTPGDNDPWAHDRFCGLALGNYVPGPLVSYSPPFQLLVHTDQDEFSSSLDTQNRGYQLRYTQLPCSTPYLFNGDQKFVG